MKILTRELARHRRRLRAVFLTDAMMRFFTVLLCALALSGLLAWALPFMLLGRGLWGLRILLAAASAICLFLFGRNLRGLSLEKCARLVEIKAPELSDQITNGLDFERHWSLRSRGTSEAMIQDSHQKAVSALVALSPSDIFPWAALKGVSRQMVLSLAVFCGLFFVPPGILREPLARLILFEATHSQLSVSPGDISVAPGADVEISASGAKSPRLLFRYGEKDWQEEAMKPKAGGFGLTLSRITEPVEYRVKTAAETSKKYQISLQRLPQISLVSVRYNYPSYTRLEEAVVSPWDGGLSAPYGTRAEIEAVLSAADRSKIMLVTDREEEFAARVRGRKIFASLILTHQSRWGFRMAGIALSEHPVEVISDAAPEVTILAPARDVILSEKGRLPIFYELRDDYGVEQIALVFKKVGSPQENRIQIERFSPAVVSKTASYEWSLAPYNFSGGDEIAYFLEVTDNNELTGRQKAVSPTFLVEIFSYEKEHGEILGKLDENQEKLLNALALEIESQKKLRETPAAVPEALSKHKESQEEIAALKKALEEILKRMETDPLARPRTREELSALLQNLSFLEKERMQPAAEALSQKRLEEASAQQEAAISEMERMSGQFEELLEQQKMNDLVSSSESLQEDTAQMLSQLQKMKEKNETLSPERKREMEKKLAEITKKISELAEKLSKMSKDLPDDFVNNPAVKSIPLTNLQKTAQELAASLASGNLEEALRQAESLAKSLESAMETLKSASSQAASPSQEDLSAKANALAKDLESLIQEEEALAKETSPHAHRTREEMLESQKQILKELAKRQRAALARIRKVLEKVSSDTSLSQAAPAFLAYGPPASALMESVLKEFETEVLSQAKSNLQKILGHLLSLQRVGESLLIEKASPDLKKKIWADAVPIKKEEESVTLEAARLGVSTSPYASAFLEWPRFAGFFKSASQPLAEIYTEGHEIYLAEKKILQDLEGASQKNPATGKAKESLKGISARQTETRGRTQALEQRVKALAQKTQAVGPEILEGFTEAGKFMEGASGALGNGWPEEGLDKEQEAISALQRAKEGLSRAGEKLAKGGGQPQQGSLGFYHTRPRQSGGHGPGGRLGVDTGFVKIPSAEEYQPPKEFREELLEGLKQKYPKTYERMIREYYRRLTE